MPSKPQKIITVIGTQFLQPIADLIAHMTARPRLPSDRISSNFYEGGYAASIILLATTMLESLIQRDRYFYRRENPGARPSSVVGDYSKTVLRYRRHARMVEVFEVRNAIAHNHVWEIEFSSIKEGGRRHHSSKLVPETHRLRVSPSPRARIPRTKLLGVNLIPARLDRTDVEKVLDTITHTLEHLYKKGTNPIKTSDEIVGFRGKHIRFDALIRESKNAP